MQGVTTLILAGGQGHRLEPLTQGRAKPVVPFAGRRLIDFTLDNCAKSGIHDACVLAQYEAAGVRRHVKRFRVFTPREAGAAFHGTADAVRRALQHFPGGERVLVLAGDHVYRMDYRELLAAHRGPATVAVAPVPRPEARELGVLAVGAEGAVEAFVEKPADPPPLPGAPDFALASMGIYVFERDVLEEYLHLRPDAVDFGHHVLPGLLDRGLRVQSFHHRAYWRDVADVGAYHGALMDFAAGLFDPGWRPERVVDGSVLGARVRIGKGAEVVESVLLDGVVVGARARLRRVVATEGARIPAGAEIGYGARGVTVVAREPVLT